MQRILTNKDTKYVFEDKDAELKVSFETALRAENHMRSMVVFFIREGEKEAFKAARAWDSVKELIRQSDPLLKNKAGVLQYDWEDGSVTFVPEQTVKGLKQKQPRGKLNDR